MKDLGDPYQYENLFYRTCHPSRIGKLVAHFKLYERILDVPGAVIECGVFKGNSLFRWAMFRSLFEPAKRRKIIAFDTFGEFPAASRDDDRRVLEGFLRQAGSRSLSEAEIHDALERRDCGADVELVAGDLVAEVAPYLERHRDLAAALIHIDVDLYEPTRTSLWELVPRLSDGGVCILDDYGIFPGATEAIDQFCSHHGFEIENFSYCRAPSFFVKR